MKNMMMMTLIAIATVNFGGSLGVLAHAADPAPTTSSALYQQLGEKKGITKLVDDFLVILLADSRTERFFAKIDQAQFKTKLVDQICDTAGGPCKYTGRSMKESHEGLEIKHGDFNALVEDLQKAMTKNKVPMMAQGKLLALFAPMHREIIEK